MVNDSTLFLCPAIGQFDSFYLNLADWDDLSSAPMN